MLKIRIGQCYQYSADNGANYRIVVVAKLGRIIFVHSVFTTGKMQECEPLQVLDTKYMKKLHRVKLGVVWDHVNRNQRS
jgi:hypothetical protein